MMQKNVRKVLSLIIFCVIVCLNITGCVDYSEDLEEKKSENSVRVVSTSMSIVYICEKLGIELVGVPESSISQVPECYEESELVGSPMAPDMEIISSLNPDWILSPASLMSDLKPKYDAIDTDYAFLNLESVTGMYKSIEQLGRVFDCQEKAQQLIDEFKDFYNDFKSDVDTSHAPTVLVLMGLPGSYVVATPESYVGNLVELAGGKNVYSDEKADFVNINTEDMLKKNPDIILTTSHTAPQEVAEMFKEEFAKNDIWKHFEAVKNGRVYSLSEGMFGMSATFDYPEALEELKEIFYSN